MIDGSWLTDSVPTEVEGGSDGSRSERARFLPAPPAGTKIWRYMDFTKFVFMLEERALFFSRADYLLDPFEGRASDTCLEGDEKLEGPSPKRNDGAAAAIGESARQRFFINSWHINEHESTAMWKLFAKSDDAIAIESTYEQLRACLPERIGAEGDPQPGHIDVALARYVDPQRTAAGGPFDFCEFLRKRKEFEHERELRAFFDVMNGEGGARKVDVAEDAGRLVDVDLGRLIGKIHLAPGSSAWYRGLVERLVRRFGLMVAVMPSDLEPRREG